MYIYIRGVQVHCGVPDGGGVMPVGGPEVRRRHRLHEDPQEPGAEGGGGRDPPRAGGGGGSAEAGAGAGGGGGRRRSARAGAY